MGEVWRTKDISSFSSPIVAKSSMRKLFSFAFRSREGVDMRGEGGVPRPKDGERGTMVGVGRGAKGLGGARVEEMGVVGVIGGELSCSMTRASVDNQS